MIPIKALLDHTRRKKTEAVWRKLPCGHRVKVAASLKGKIPCPNPECSPIVVIRHDTPSTGAKL